MLISSISPTIRKRGALMKNNNTSAVPKPEKGRLHTGYSLREHPVSLAIVCWFHIRIHNRQSLEYYRLSKPSWKIHEKIAPWFSNKSQGFLLMLVESFKPERFPLFRQRIFRPVFPRFCTRSTQKLARYFCEYARWIVIGHHQLTSRKLFSRLGFPGWN